MRTTLSIDDDVAAELEALRTRGAMTFKEAVNTALRRGLLELGRPKKRQPFHTEPIDMGTCLVPSLDNIGEVLDELEIEGNRRG